MQHRDVLNQLDREEYFHRKFAKTLLKGIEGPDELAVRLIAVAAYLEQQITDPEDFWYVVEAFLEGWHSYQEQKRKSQN